MGGSGSHRRDPIPAEAAEEEGGAEAALPWWRGVPEDLETLEGWCEEEEEEAGEEAGEEGQEGEERRGGGGGAAQQRGRQRLHTRLYPVEISRALKSSESMLPVCFCSRTQGQQRRPGPE